SFSLFFIFYFSLYLLLFFFYYSPHHRHLHSFPTRRSSDLEMKLDAVYSTVKIFRGVHSTHLRHHCLRDQNPSQAWPQAAPVCIRDRKSTRLNSSHDQISYAVFCLKKKKKKKKNKKSDNKRSSRKTRDRTKYGRIISVCTIYMIDVDY